MSFMNLSSEEKVHSLTRLKKKRGWETVGREERRGERGPFSDEL